MCDSDCKKNSTKKVMVDSISKIIVGSTDSSGNTITNVLIKYDEFAIYEIEHNDVNMKIKVLIDGCTNESEELLTKRLNAVKHKYIEAKGILFRSTNYSMMKQSVAHTLATCLNSDSNDGNKKFDQLIERIKKEQINFLKNRCWYLAPSTAVVILFSILNICIYIWLQAFFNAKLILVSVSLLATSLGGCLSILINVKSVNFEEALSWYHYCLLGIERWLLSCIAGAIVFIAIKSGLVFPSFANSNNWALMSILVLAGFSESLVPSILSKINNLKEST